MVRHYALGYGFHTFPNLLKNLSKRGTWLCYVYKCLNYDLSGDLSFGFKNPANLGLSWLIQMFFSITEMYPVKAMKHHLELCPNVFDVSSESEDETQLNRSVSRELCPVHSNVPSCQQHLIIMQFPCRHCQRIEFVVFSTSHYSHPGLGSWTSRFGHDGLWKVLQSWSLGSGDEDIA